MVPASEATINLHWESGQEFRGPTPHSSPHSVVQQKRKPGAQIQNNKKNLTQNIRLILLGAAKDGLLTICVYLAIDDGYWTQLIKQLGTNRSTWNGAKPNPRLKPPQRLSLRAAALSTPSHRQAFTNLSPSFRACD